MKLSADQWIAIALLDLGIRAGVLTAGGVFFFPMVIYAVLLSLLHLTALALVSLFVRMFSLDPRAAIATILVLTNVVFVACFAPFGLDLDQSARLAACPKPTPTCTWLDGRVAWYGIRVFGMEATVLVAINLICALIVLPFGRPRRDERLDLVAPDDVRPIPARHQEVVPPTVRIFSLGQWIAIVLLDFVVRAGVMTFGGFLFFMIPFALVLSLLHLTVLAVVNYAVEALRLRRLIAIPAILIVTNLVFVTCFVAYEIDPDRNYRRTSCGSVGDKPQTCTWVDGRITSHGVRRLAEHASTFVAINLVCVLIVLPFGRPRSDDSRRSMTVA